MKQALFVIPIAAIIAAPVLLDLKNKSVQQTVDSHVSTKSDDTTSWLSTMNPFNASNEVQDYSMPEPFTTDNTFGMTYSMRKSMDPGTWMRMMINMMNPHGTSAETLCASCHEGKDVERYQKQFGPMMQSLWGQYKTMMDPHVMGSMMNPTVMTQMMHQMMAIPMQMLMPMPMVTHGASMNPHMGVPATPPASIANVMNPKQYEQWYNQQQKRLYPNK